MPYPFTFVHRLPAIDLRVVVWVALAHEAVGHIAQLSRGQTIKELAHLQAAHTCPLRSCSYSAQLSTVRASEHMMCFLEQQYGTGIET